MAAKADHAKRFGRPRRLVFWLAMFLYACLVVVMFELVFRVGNPWQWFKARHYFDNNIFYAQVREGFQDTLWKKKWAEYKPNVSLEIPLASGSVYSIKINSHGFRTHEFGPKEPGVVRIIAIGGSTTIQGDRNDETYPALLEKQLKRRFPEKKIEVLNFGVSGTQSHYWLTHFDRLLSFEPDMIIQYNAINDLSNERYYEEYYASHRFLAYFRKSYLYQAFYPPQADEFIGVYERISSNFIRLRNALADHGIGYVTATFATPEPESLDYYFEGYLDFIVKVRRGKGARYLKYKNYHQMIEAYNAHLQERMISEGVPLVDLHRQIAEEKYFVDECHMNPEGIKRQAQAFFPIVADFLVRHSPE